MVYDQDKGAFDTKKDLLGRIWIDLEKNEAEILSPVDNKPHKVTCHSEAKWYNMIFDAKDVEEGKLLVGYDIIPISMKHLVLYSMINYL